MIAVVLVVSALSSVAFLLFVAWKKGLLSATQDEHFDPYMDEKIAQYGKIEQRIAKERTKYEQIRSEEDRKATGSALMKRVMANLEVIVPFEQQREGIVGAYRKGYVPPKEWKAFVSATNSISVELEEIKQEAEGIKEGWGESIFQHALQLMANEKEKKELAEYLNKKKAKEEKEAKKKEKQQMEEERQRQLKLQKQVKLADKIAEKLMEEEEARVKNQNKKTK